MFICEDVPLQMVFLVFLIELQGLRAASLQLFLCKYSLLLIRKMGVPHSVFIALFLSCNQKLATHSLRDEGFILSYYLGLCSITWRGNGSCRESYLMTSLTRSSSSALSLLEMLGLFLPIKLTMQRLTIMASKIRIPLFHEWIKSLYLLILHIYTVWE